MDRRRVQKLPLGVYRVFWKDGGSSVATVGMMADGARWLAPSNWVWPSSTSWLKVDHVQLIEEQ